MESERARELLRRERQRIEQALAKLRLPGGEELAGQDEMADSASQLYEEEFGEGQADDLRDKLASVERTEGRLIDGNYGLPPSYRIQGMAEPSNSISIDASP